MVRVRRFNFSTDELLDFAVDVGHQIFRILEVNFLTGEVFPLLQSHVSGSFCQIFHKFQHKNTSAGLLIPLSRIIIPYCLKNSTGKKKL